MSRGRLAMAVVAMFLVGLALDQGQVHVIFADGPVRCLGPARPAGKRTGS